MTTLKRDQKHPIERRGIVAKKLKNVVQYDSNNKKSKYANAAELATNSRSVTMTHCILNGTIPTTAH